MATSTELLRAAEHMRHQGALMLEDERWHAGTSYCEAADMLELEAKRLQAIEAKQSKHTWPEGWPPFAVLRRAFEAIGVGPTPSTLWVSRYGTGGRYQTGKQYADEIRGRWAIALNMAISDPSSP